MSLYLGSTKINKLYLGSTKIKKAYLGSTKVYSTGEIVQGPAVSNLSRARGFMATGTIGGYGIFAGGCNAQQTTHYNTVDAYDSNITKSTPTALSNSWSSCFATPIGNYLVIGPGKYGSSGTTINTVNAYNTSLVRSTPTTFSSSASDYGAATLTDKYALFAGGYSWNGSGAGTALSTINAYNSALTRSNPVTLSTAKSSLVGTSIGNYVLFAGGQNSSSALQNSVDFFNEDLTRSTSSISVTDYYFEAGHNDDYAIVMDQRKRMVACFDKELTRKYLSTPPYQMSGIGPVLGMEDNIVITEGNSIYYYDSSLAINAARPFFETYGDFVYGAYAGKYILIGGGVEFSSQSAFTTMDSIYYQE